MHGRVYSAVKTCSDRLIAAAGLCVLTPLLPIVALIIRLDSPGPALFRQRRIGRRGVPFTLYKLRTLRHDAEPYAPKPREADPRVTRLGAFLRRHGWDELPQLLAVLTGKMSLVGPRPEMPFIADTYTPAERARLRVRPGIAGYWQVMASDTTPMRAGIAWDRYYLRHASLALDGWIVLRAIGVMVGAVRPNRQTRRRARTEPRVRVIQVLEATAGGTLTHIDLLLRHLDRSKIDVRLACSTTRGGSVEEKLTTYRSIGIPIRVIDMVRRIAPMRDGMSTLRLYRYFRSERPDVVHTHSSKAGFVGRLAAWLAGVPVIIHTPHGFAFQDDRSRQLQRAYGLLERLAGRWTKVLLCVSGDERGLALKYRLVPPVCARVIYNSIDPSAADGHAVADDALATTLGLPRGAPVIGIVANLRPEKGLDDFLRAARIMLDARSDLRFLIVGSGSLRSALEREIDRLHIRGHVTIAASHDVIWKYLALMDVVMSTSLREGLPYAILEAMAMRRAIVATAVTGSREIILDGETGLIVPPRHPSAMADAALQLINDPERRARLGAQARAFVESRHAIDPAIRSLESLYADAVRAALPLRARRRLRTEPVQA